MAADVDVNINIQAVDGTAASTIDQSTQAIQRLSNSSGELQQRFQQRFQHIGLMLFAGDALRASGLGRETRMVVSSLNLALTEGAAAAGISSGGIMLVVVALAALAGILVKVIGHHKDEAEAIQKSIDQTAKTLDTYNAEIKELEDLQAAGGRLTPAMQALLEADKAVADHLKSNLIVSQNQEIAVLEKQRAAIQSSADMHAFFAKALIPVRLALEAILLPFEKIVQYVQAFGHHLVDLLPHMTTHAHLTDAQTLKYQELTAEIDKLKLHHQATFKGMIDDAKNYQAQWDATVSFQIQSEINFTKLARQYNADLYKSIEADQKEQVKQHEAATKKMEEYTKHMADQLGNDIGQALAKSLVEGKNFTEQMTAAFNHFVEQAIEDIIRIETEMMVLKALGYEGPVGGGGGGFIPGFATGVDTMVDQPTLFLAGETGPEYVHVSPVGGGGGSGGGGGGSVSVGDIHINMSVANLDSGSAQQILQSLADELRRGTVDAVRFAVTSAGLAGQNGKYAY